MAELGFSLLGPMRGQRGPEPLPLGAPQQQAMLAVLLLRRGGAAGIGDLVDALWGEYPPRTAVTTIRTYAWRWRKVLEPEQDRARVLTSFGDGYRLTLPAAALDVNQAEQLAARAEALAADGHQAQARDLLNQALGQWRGEPLAGLPGPFAERERSRLGELRLALLEERVGLDLALGRVARCIPELTALTIEHPLRERCYGLLMRALWQEGRQADALAVYRGAREQLVEQLGLEPGQDLESLHRRILSGEPAPRTAQPSAHPARGTPGAGPAPDPAADPGDPADPPAAPPAVTAPVLRPAQLPCDPADFTGRADAAGQIGQALAATLREAMAVVVVTGMGGVGKTTLAVHAAHATRHAFPGGELYADLRGADTTPADPADTLAAFLAALGTAPSDIPDGVEARSSLFRSLSDERQLLVVLDNARDTAQIRPLLPGSADCAVLVTSRSRLTSVPSVQIDLDVFTPDEAVALLTRAIGARRVADEPDAAVELVASCGYLPLAVRIVAARLAARPNWTLRSLTVRLADERRRLDELRFGDLAVEAAFELGYRQLTAEQARMFRTAVWSEGVDFSTAAAAALLDTPERDAEDLLESLVDAGMLDSFSAGRYQYHDLLRAFARRTPEPDRARAQLRLLDYFLTGARTAFQLAVPGDPAADALARDWTPRRSARTGPDLPDLHAARQWARAEAEGAVALVGRLAAQPPPAGIGRDELRAGIDTLIALSPLGGAGGKRLEGAAGALVDAAVLARDRYAEGRARFLRGTIALSAGRLGEAGQDAELAAAACREVGDKVILRQALNDLGLIAQSFRRHDEAIGCFDEAIALADELGHRSGKATTTVNAALARVRSGRPAEAIPVCETMLADAGNLGDVGGTAYALYVLGLALHDLGRYQEAARRYRECLALAATAGRRAREAQAHLRLAETLRSLRSPAEAVREAETALRICAEAGYEQDRAHALVALGRALADLGHHQDCLLRLEEAQAIFRRLGLPDAADVAALLHDLVRLAQDSGGRAPLPVADA